MTEENLAAIVVDWLEAAGAEVFQEVELEGGVADIVARFPDELWIVETKRSFSIDLLAQVIKRQRLHYAHRLLMAVPKYRLRHDRPASNARLLAHELGFGLLEVTAAFRLGTATIPASVGETCPSKAHPIDLGKLDAILRVEHKNHGKAGSKAGRWTKFRGTCERLAEIVAAEPGITMSAVLERLDHHYATKASARSSLMHWIQNGKVPGVRLDVGGSGVALYPVRP